MHYLSLSHFAGQPVVYGVSTWDIPAGRLRREMRQTTILRTSQDIARWARRHKDVGADEVNRAKLHLTSGPT